jgi:3-deoxy-D-manno-octulosonic-acid transferase
LEPAAQGLPIVIGPHVFNAPEIAASFVKLGACRIVSNSNELATTVSDLINRPEEAGKIGKNGFAVLEQNRGSLKRLLVLLEPLLANDTAN